MNKKFRFGAAALLAIMLVLVAANVWAAPKFEGTVPKPPEKSDNEVKDTNSQECTEANQDVDMETAIFSDQSCALTVVLVVDPSTYAPVPDAGLEFIGDTFLVTTADDGAPVQVCYAFPPEFADKAAKLYKLNESVNPAAWEVVEDAVIVDGQLCATDTEGVFTLIGTK